MSLCSHSDSARHIGGRTKAGHEPVGGECEGGRDGAGELRPRDCTTSV